MSAARVPLPAGATLAWGWLRQWAGQGLWWALALRPALGINNPGLPVAVFTLPQPGGSRSPAGPGGGGDQATAQTFPPGQKSPTASPHPSWVGAVTLILHCQGPPVQLTWEADGGWEQGGDQETGRGRDRKK